MGCGPSEVTAFPDEWEQSSVIKGYNIIGDLGEGSYGTIQLAQSSLTGKRVAIKCVPRKGKGGSVPTEEIEILKQCQHPNIVNLEEVIDEPSSCFLYLVLEYVNGNVVMKLNDSGFATTSVIPERIAYTYTQQICAGLEYLHKVNIVHRDLKPDNILVTMDKSVVKLADFGISHIFSSEDDAARKTIGTPMFMAPEMCRGVVFSSKYAEIWAFGVTLYSMLCGYVPFTARSQSQLFDVILTKPVTFPTLLSNEVVSLLKRMLERDLSLRITLSEVRDHPWVSGLSYSQSQRKSASARKFSLPTKTPHMHAAPLRVRNKVAKSLPGPPEQFAFNEKSGVSPKSQNIRDAQIPNILIVEGEHLLREFTTKMLYSICSQEINVEICNDGYDAVNMAKTKRYLLIIMDIHLSSLNGCDAALAMRDYESQMNMTKSHIIGLTSDDKAMNYSNMCITSGMDDVIFKPITPMKIISIFAKCGLESRSIHDIITSIHKFCSESNHSWYQDYLATISSELDNNSSATNQVNVPDFSVDQDGELEDQTPKIPPPQLSEDSLVRYLLPSTPPVTIPKHVIAEFNLTPPPRRCRSMAFEVVDTPNPRLSVHSKRMSLPSGFFDNLN